jgi:hypothetical protein
MADNTAPVNEGLPSTLAEGPANCNANTQNYSGALDGAQAPVEGTDFLRLGTRTDYDFGRGGPGNDNEQFPVYWDQTRYNWSSGYSNTELQDFLAASGWVNNYFNQFGFDSSSCAVSMGNWTGRVCDFKACRSSAVPPEVVAFRAIHTEDPPLTPAEIAAGAIPGVFTYGPAVVTVTEDDTYGASGRLQTYVVTMPFPYVVLHNVQLEDHDGDQPDTVLASHGQSAAGYTYTIELRWETSQANRATWIDFKLCPPTSL